MCSWIFQTNECLNRISTFCGRKSSCRWETQSACPHFACVLVGIHHHRSTHRQIDARGLIALYYIFCKSTIQEKISKAVISFKRHAYSSQFLFFQVDSLFSLFDFNKNDEISKDELVSRVPIAKTGTHRLCRRIMFPSSSCPCTYARGKMTCTIVRGRCSFLVSADNSLQVCLLLVTRFRRQNSERAWGLKAVWV